METNNVEQMKIKAMIRNMKTFITEYPDSELTEVLLQIIDDTSFEVEKSKIN